VPLVGFPERWVTLHGGRVTRRSVNVCGERKCVPENDHKLVP
jgi:hypothetical protein